MHIRKSSLWCWWIGIIYIFSQQFLYLLPESKILQITAYVLLLSLFICIHLKSPRIECSWFTVLMISTIFLSLLASIMEKVIYTDVSFIKSFLQQTQWWIYSLLFLSITKLLKLKKVTHEQIINTLLYLGITQVLIGITQYLLFDIVNFVYVSSNLRYGEPRYYYPIVLMVLVLFISLDRFIDGSKRSKKQLFIILLCFIQIVIVQKFRSTLMAVMGSIGIGFIFWKKDIKSKTLFLIIGGIILSIVVINSNIIQDTINSLIYNSDNSLGMRNTLIEFLNDNIKQHLFLGSGWISSEEAYYYAASAYRNTYNWNVFAFADGGVFSFVFSYGFCGLIWIVLMWVLMISRGYKIIRMKKKYIYFMFPMYMLIPMYIDIHWYIHEQFFVLATFCAIQEYYYYECKLDKVKYRDKNLK